MIARTSNQNQMNFNVLEMNWQIRHFQHDGLNVFPLILIYAIEISGLTRVDVRMMYE